MILSMGDKSTRMKTADYTDRLQGNPYAQWARGDSNPKPNAVPPLTDVNTKNRDRVRNVIILVVESFNN